LVKIFIIFYFIGYYWRILDILEPGVGYFTG